MIIRVFPVGVEQPLRSSVSDPEVSEQLSNPFFLQLLTVPSIRIPRYLPFPRTQDNAVLRQIFSCWHSLVLLLCILHRLFSTQIWRLHTFHNMPPILILLFLGLPPPPCQHCHPRHPLLPRHHPRPPPFNPQHRLHFSAWSSAPFSAFQTQPHVSSETNSLPPMKWLPASRCCEIMYQA